MHTISAEFAQALQQMLREFNQNKLTNKRGLTQGPNANWRPMQVAKATSDIDAATDVDTPGTGTAELYLPDPDSADPIEDRGYIQDEAPVDRAAAQPWSYQAKEIDVTNPFSSSIAQDSFFIVTYVRGQWVPLVGGGGGGGGESDCCCDCSCVEPNLLHPANFYTVRDWDVTLGSNTAWARADNDEGDLRVKAGTYRIVWDGDLERWTYTLTTSDVDWRNNEGTVSTPLTVTGTLYMEWVSETDPVLLRFDVDATGDIVQPFP